MSLEREAEGVRVRIAGRADTRATNVARAAPRQAERAQAAAAATRAAGGVPVPAAGRRVDACAFQCVRRRAGQRDARNALAPS